MKNKLLSIVTIFILLNCTPRVSKYPIDKSTLEDEPIKKIAVFPVIPHNIVPLIMESDTLRNNILTINFDDYKNIDQNIYNKLFMNLIVNNFYDPQMDITDRLRSMYENYTFIPPDKILEKLDYDCSLLADAISKVLYQYDRIYQFSESEEINEKKALLSVFSKTDALKKNRTSDMMTLLCKMLDVDAIVLPTLRITAVGKVGESVFFYEFQNYLSAYYSVDVYTHSGDLLFETIDYAKTCTIATKNFDNSINLEKESDTLLNSTIKYNYSNFINSIIPYLPQLLAPLLDQNQKRFKNNYIFETPAIFVENECTTIYFDKNQKISNLHFFKNFNSSTNGIINTSGSLVNIRLSPQSTYEWKGLDENGNQLKTGKYYFQYTIGTLISPVYEIYFISDDVTKSK